MGMRKLTDKQARFVEEYIVDLNGKQAAIRAGYSNKYADRIAYQLLGKPRVRAALQAAQRRVSAETGVTHERVIKEISRLAFASSRNVMSWGPDGVAIKSSDELTDDEAAAVTSVKAVSNASGVETIEVRLADKLGALEKLAKHLGMYDQAGDDRNADDMTDEEIEAELAEFERQEAEADPEASPI